MASNVPPPDRQRSANQLDNRQSRAWFARAKRVLPGGVTRSTIDRSPHPMYVAKGKGPWLTDIDGNRYLDFANNFTTLIQGHAFPPVIEALRRQLESGSCFSNPTVLEVGLAEILVERIPVVDQVRFMNTGTEAVMFALKVARAATGRPKIAKFEGAYHGAYDWAEVSERSAPDTWGAPYPASVEQYRGMPRSVLDDVVVLPFNDLELTRQILARHTDDLACVLIDLMPSRIGLIPIDPDYLAFLRRFTKQHGALLISDEVLNLRQSHAGASAAFGVEPDLVAMGKIIGGGLPIGAVGGPADVMRVFDDGQTSLLPQSGTFSANPLSMVAGTAAMMALGPQDVDHINRLGQAVRDGLNAVIATHELTFTVTGRASLFRIHPKRPAPRSFRDAYCGPDEVRRLKGVLDGMRQRGVVMASMGLGTISTPMTDAHVHRLIEAFKATVTSRPDLMR